MHLLLSRARPCQVTETDTAMQPPWSRAPLTEPFRLRSQWCGAPPSAIEEALDRVANEHGSLDGYLDSIGVSVAVREDIREALTEEAVAS